MSNQHLNPLNRRPCTEHVYQPVEFASFYVWQSSPIQRAHRTTTHIDRSRVP